MSGSKLSHAAKDGYYRATRTLICQYCAKIRSRDNIHQIKPRIKCVECHNKSQGFGREA